MSLSIYDAQILSQKIKEARSKMNLTQAECAELLDYSLSFQKDLERCRCSPSIENFYHICRTLNMSANECIFPERTESASSFQELVRLLTRCDENALRVIKATAESLLSVGHSNLG